MGRVIGLLIGLSLLTIIVIWLVVISVDTVVFILTGFGKNRKVLHGIVPLWLQKLLGISKIDAIGHSLFMFKYGWSFVMVILILCMHFYFKLVHH